MSSETRFYCDCCKKEINSHSVLNGFGKVILSCKEPMLQRVGDDPYYFNEHNYDLCSDCRFKVWGKIRQIFEEGEK